MGKIIETIKTKYTLEEFCNLTNWSLSKIYRIDRCIDDAKVKDLALICNELEVNPLDVCKYQFIDSSYHDYKYFMDMQFQLNIVDLFTLSEQRYFVDMLNGSSYTNGISPKDYLKISILESDTYYGLATKWEISLSDFVKKIDTLSEFDAYIIIQKVKAWWNNNNRDLDYIFNEVEEE